MVTGIISTMSAFDLNRRGLIAGLTTLAATAAVAGPKADPIAETTAGPVSGRRRAGLSVFKGIRYGAPPARFQPPRPPTPWTDPVRTIAFGHASTQRGTEPDQSEDCLFLNLWTPGLDAYARPVMVYIHGGAYASGSGSSPIYDGQALALRGDVVVVTLNHRLGPLGYLYLDRLAPGFEESGAAGMLDLVLALRWVRDNIARFGGDPGRVMLFGQSGGGAKIATLMAMPAANGLFHRAATMSGQQVTVSGPGNATRRSQALLDRLGAGPADLLTLPAGQILDAAAATDPVIGSGSLYFGPVLDERNLMRHPFYPDAPPLAANVPMIIGNTHDETRGLIGRSDPSTFNLTWDELPSRLIPQLRVDIDPHLVVRTYRDLYPAYSPSDVFFAATTAARSWRAAIIEAELRAAQGAPAFVYQLDHGSPFDGGKWGAPHTFDIPLVFGNLEAEGSITGAAPETRALSGQMMDSFIAFARTGNPNTPLIPAWEPYQLDRRQTLIWDDPVRMADDPRGAERRLFEKVPFIQQGT